MTAATHTPQTVSLLHGPLDGQTAKANQVIVGKQMTGPQKGELIYGLEYLLVIMDPDDPKVKHRYIKQAGGGYYLFDGTRTRPPNDREETP